MLAPCDFPVLGEGERQKQRDKKSEEQREGGREKQRGETDSEGREPEEGKDRGSEGGREGEEAEEQACNCRNPVMWELLNAVCEHRSTSAWKEAGLKHPQSMPL